MPAAIEVAVVMLYSLRYSVIRRRGDYIVHPSQTRGTVVITVYGWCLDIAIVVEDLVENLNARKVRSSGGIGDRIKIEKVFENLEIIDEQLGQIPAHILLTLREVQQHLMFDVQVPVMLEELVRAHKLAVAFVASEAAWFDG
jgi:hypothetical protein